MHALKFGLGNWIVTCLLVLCGSWCQAQQESARVANDQIGQAESPDELSQARKDSDAESELIEGLLDLLESGQPNDSQESAAEPSSSEQGPGNGVPPIEIAPQDIGLDGEDLGEDSANPLNSVRQSMLIAAGYLERGQTGNDTQTIQRDIVQRLDDLIDQLEQPMDQNQPQSESQEQQQGAANESQSMSSQQQSSSQQNESQTRPRVDAENSESMGNRPGFRGNETNPILQLSDPTALQENVWGQLPERVRKQMQSRMVERFLPSYRDQIEAYFQALLTRGRP